MHKVERPFSQNNGGNSKILNKHSGRPQLRVPGEKDDTLPGVLSANWARDPKGWQGRKSPGKDKKWAEEKGPRGKGVNTKKAISKK